MLFVGWLVVAYAIYGVDLRRGRADRHVGDSVAGVFTTPQGWTLIVLGNLAGRGVRGRDAGVRLVSFPMVVDKPVDAALAVRTSLAAVRKNPREAFGWGLRVAGLLLLGLLPFAIGLAVVLPWLGYATWHLYTRIVVR